MRLTRLIVLTVALVTSAGFYMLYSYLTEDLESQTFQATEEALIDTAYILASVLEEEIEDGTINVSLLSNSLTDAHKKSFTAKIHNLTKTKVGTQVYLTDPVGIVIFDSNHAELVGIDHSRYNNVYLALRDQYGARSTREDATDSNSSVLYIGVPIKKDNEILGTLTVYKAQKDVSFFITTRKKWITLSITMIALGIIVFTISVFAWIFRPIGKLTRYAHAITRGGRPVLPKLGKGREVNTLGRALKEMRETLDGRSYIENYTQILTHELKSPLAAIRGSSELLTEEMPILQRKKFIENIQNETIRSQSIIDGLLKLAQLEAQPEIVRNDVIILTHLFSELKNEYSERLATKALILEIQLSDKIEINGDRNLLKAAFANLIENAIHYSPDQARIIILASHIDSVTHITFEDMGTGIPEYALDKVFDRFYSLSKSGSKQKSSGLGLTFVKEIIELHQGSISVANNEDVGATFKIELPQNSC